MQIAHGCGSQPDTVGKKQKLGRLPPISEQFLITRKRKHEKGVIFHFLIISALYTQNSWVKGFKLK